MCSPCYLSSPAPWIRRRKDVFPMLPHLSCSLDQKEEGCVAHATSPLLLLHSKTTDLTDCPSTHTRARTHILVYVCSHTGIMKLHQHLRPH